jgi:hypothetical protein
LEKFNNDDYVDIAGLLAVGKTLQYRKIKVGFSVIRFVTVSDMLTWELLLLRNELTIDKDYYRNL